MKFKSVYEDEGRKTFVIVLDAGDEVISTLTEFAQNHGLDAASFTAIGAFGAATLGYFDMERKEYERIPVHEQLEVLSLSGNVAAREDGDPRCTRTPSWEDATARRGAGTCSRPASALRWRSCSRRRRRACGARPTRRPGSP